MLRADVVPSQKLSQNNDDINQAKQLKKSRLKNKGTFIVEGK